MIMPLTLLQKKQELQSIEQQLLPLVKQTGKAWVSVYKLLQIVETNELYTVSHKSYTAWINDFATKNNLTLSLLWKKKKAGKFYMNYANYYAKQNIVVPPLEKTNYDPEILVMVEKITAGNMIEAHQMLNKNNTGALTRYDLKIMWQSVKSERERQGLPIMRTNSHDESTFEELSYSNYDKFQTKPMDIITALCRPSWLIAHKISAGHYYRCFSNIALGNLENEVIIIENCTGLKENKLFSIHSVKIIIDDDNVVPSEVMYPNYADLYWIATSLNHAQTIIPHIKKQTNIGIIIYNKTSDHLLIYRNAKPDNNFGIQREQTIENLFLSLL